MIGRQEKLQQITQNIQQNQPTLLVGEIGIGKTQLLKQLQDKHPKAVYLESIAPLKSALLSIMQALHKRGKLHLEGIEADYLTWEELLKKVNRLNIQELIDTIQNNLKNRQYILLIDHLETATPSMTKKIETLMESALVIGAANKLKPSLKKLWWHFEQIEILPLTQKQSQQLLWTLLEKNTISDAKLLERKVLTQANGNPLVISQLAQKAQRQQNLTTENIRQLQHQAGNRFIDITPVFFVIGALIVATRFIALGLNSADLYIFAGVCGGLFMGLRYFLYKSMRSSDD